MTFDVLSLGDLYQPDVSRIELARARQAAVWCGEEPDAWPIVCGGALTEAQRAIPSPNFKEAFNDIDQMVCGQVRGACAMANSRSDGVPSVRGNYGTGVMLSCLGLEQDVFPDKMPWLKQHLSKEDASDLTPDDIKIQGAFERGLAFMRRHKEILGNRLPMFCMDTQGPFDLAHLLLGDEIFYLIYDDPVLLHHVMEICLELGIRTHEWMKGISGEPRTVCHHSNALYSESGGIRICEDTTAIVGRDVIETFAMPYTQRLARHFGGAWVHYCGRNDDLTDLALQIPEVRGINFGHIPGHQHDQPFEVTMERCLSAGKVYFGTWPLRDGENGRDFLRRMHTWASQGCLIPQVANIASLDGFSEVGDVLDFWYSL